MLSILTTTLNSARTLRETLASVRELAARTAVEHLLLDAGSTDGTWDLIDEYVTNAPWARARRTPGMPLVESLNELVSQARGEHILVLHGDDRLVPEAVQTTLQQTSPDAVLCGEVHIRHKDGRTLGTRRCDPTSLRRYMSINHPAMIVPTEVYRRVGGFDPRYPVSFDYEWTWRAWRSGVEFDCHAIVLAEVRLGGLSTVRSREAAAEILLFKARGGAIGSAAAGYVAFLVKRGAELLLPTGAVEALRRWKRARPGSVDDYPGPATR